jgi:hypothetical protein
MHQQSSLDILAQCENGYVSQCECCQDFNVTYKNVLLVFNEESMERFFEWILSYRSSRDNYQPLPHGRDRIYSSPHNNLFLVFNDEELEDLHQLAAQVSLVLEARRIAALRRNSA